MPSIRPVSSRPARPTNGSPVRSSCSPGPSPTNIRSACGSPDAEHHLRARLGQRAAGADQRVGLEVRERRERRRFQKGHGGRSGSQAGSRSYATELRTRRGRHFGRQHPHAVEVGLDGAGGERERDVAVVTGVRRMDRPGQSVVRRSGTADGTGASCRRTFVTTTARWCCLQPRTAPVRESRATSLGALDPASTVPSAATMSPTELTTTRRADHGVAVTRRWRCRARRIGRIRRPATSRRRAPVPAPTRPVVASAGSAWAAASAARPSSGTGREPLPRAHVARAASASSTFGRSGRSKSAAAGTIGTGPPRVGKPRPWSAKARITPSAVANPNADPPDSTTASTCSTVQPGIEQRGLPGRRAPRRAPRRTRRCSGGTTRR